MVSGLKKPACDLASHKIYSVFYSTITDENNKNKV